MTTGDSGHAEPAERGSRLRNGGLVALVFLLALAVRILPLPTVFTERGIVPGGMADEYYHLRRIVYSVEHFPEVLSFDPYVSFPSGGEIHWPPGFDWAIAALARLLVGAGKPGAVETVAAWVPVLLGSVTVLGVFAVGRVAFGVRGGAVAGLLLALLPAHVGFSMIGSVDHHVAEALAAVALLGLGMAWLRVEGGRRGTALSVGLGLALALPLLVWPGFLIHAAVAQLFLAGAMLGTPERTRAIGRARSLAIAHGVATAVVLPFCLGPAFAQYGPWSPLVLSRFQPAWLGAASFAFGAVAWLWTTRAGARRPQRIAVAAGVAAAGVGGVLASAPELRDALLYASGWFTEAEAFQSQVDELSPLSVERGAALFSYAIFVFPAAWLLVALRAWRQRALDLGLLLLFAAVFMALALHQVRFSNSFSVPYALVWGGAAVHAVPLLRERIPGWSRLGWSAGLAACIATAVAFIPCGRFYAAQLERSRYALAHPEAHLDLVPAKEKRVHLGAARWLARSTPPTGGYLDASVRPEYGVLGPWYVGHLLRYVSERPMVQDNFGVYGGRENFARAREYFTAEDEAEAAALLDRLAVRYVVSDRSGSGLVLLDSAGPRTMTYRLARRFGSAGAVEDPATGRRIEVPALVHHRLVYHARSSPGAALYAPPPEVSVAVYERVAGARAEGSAEPGARVEARLRVTTRAGLRHLPRAESPLHYVASTRADESGRYAITLPYSTDEPFSDAVRVVGPYQLESGGRTARLEVPEAAVRAGTRVAAPTLTSDAEGR